MAIIQKALFITLIFLSCSFFLSSCSLSEGEPRITMCQKVTQKLLEVPEINWLEQHQETEELSKIIVHLLFSVNDKTENDEHTDTLTAVCIYAYNDIAEYDVVGRE